MYGRRLYQSSEDILAEMARNIENNIKNEDVEEFLERVLSISRHQILNGGRWETDYYELLVTFGGSNIWIRTDGRIIVAWADMNIERIITDKDVLEKLKEIHDYLESMQ